MNTSPYVVAIIFATAYVVYFALHVAAGTNAWRRAARTLPARRIRGLLFGGPFLLVAACGGSGTGGVGGSTTGSTSALVAACAPGEQVACACTGSDTGFQICDASGDGFGACMGCASGPTSSAATGSGAGGGSTASAGSGAGGSPPTACADTVPPTGGNADVIVYMPSDGAIVWQYAPVETVSVTDVTVYDFTNANQAFWSLEVFADDGTGTTPAYPANILATSAFSNAYGTVKAYLKQPLLLEKGSVYWFGIGVIGSGTNFALLCGPQSGSDKAFTLGSTSWTASPNAGHPAFIVDGLCGGAL